MIGISLQYVNHVIGQPQYSIPVRSRTCRVLSVVMTRSP